MSGTGRLIVGAMSVLACIAAGLYAAYSFLLYQLSVSCWDGPQSGGCGHGSTVRFVVPLVALIVCVVAGTVGYRLISGGLEQNRAEYFRARAAADRSDDSPA